MKQISSTNNFSVLSSPNYLIIFQRSFFKYPFVFLLAAISMFISSCQKQELQANSQKQDLLTNAEKQIHQKKSVPFKGKFTLAFTATGVLLSGQGTHIGKFTFFAPSEGNTSTITAANGDQIFTSYAFSAHDDLGDNMVQAIIDNTITGGTGRFAGAAGSFNISVLINETAGTGEGTFDGTISY